MLKRIFLGIAILLVVFFIYVALQSPDYKISRELVIKAPPEVLFAYINNSKKTNEWMPWKESDPDLLMQYSGPDEGVGSKSSWNSPGRMGIGQCEVVESIPNRSVKSKLIYIKPMAMEQMSEMSLTPVSDGTLMRWTVTGQNNFMGRMFCVFMNMDKMVGGEFLKGLNNLKRMVEKK